MKQLLLFFLLLPLTTLAQTILSGPVIGALKPHTATMILQLSQGGAVELHIQPNEGVEIEKEVRTHGFIALYLSNLQAHTQYAYQVTTATQSLEGSFRTFPEEGQRGSYTFVTGSCQETENGKVFDVIPKHNPLFMMHTGDFAYPDYRMGRDYTGDFDKVAESYTMRYNENRMKKMLRYIPLDYVFDDHDHVFNDGGRLNGTSLRFERKGMFRTQNFLTTNDYPFTWHTNAVKGYMEFFPHYEMADTAEAIHHSFTMGNAEFFVLDRCSSRRQSMEALFVKDKKGRLQYVPKPEHELFGKKQLDWLKEGLKNSTADWKFIVSGVPFNKSLIKVLRTGVKYQFFSTKQYSAFVMAFLFSNYWSAYPYEMNEFYDFLEKEAIQDVIVISGDTHHNVMDDGKNAGLPELNASGLSVEETSTARYLKWVGLATMRFRVKKGLWNQGGNGVGNRNYKSAFGKVRIEGNDFVELSIIDEDGGVVSAFRVYHSKKK